MKREELRKLRQWQDRLETAKEAIQPELDRMGKRESIYDGDPTIYRPDGAKAEAGRASHVRNVAFELVEAQVESDIPTPKVTAKPTATPNMYVRVTAAPNGTYFTLEKGMMGEPVKKLQQALKSAGYYSGTCDGYYGDATVKAVKNYQRAKGLVQDGKAGPATQRYLYEGDFPDQA